MQVSQSGKMVRLRRSFFTRPALQVAKELLGKYLARRIGKKILYGRIVETEAYIGPKDRASHAFGGKRTERNRAEFLAGGHVYIYLVYGMHWQFNISTGAAGSPECVLIRALESLKPQKTKPSTFSLREANGPGKLCRWLKLDKSFYAEDLTKSKRLWVEDCGVRIKSSDIASGPRIGIDYAGKFWARKPWRFYIKGNSHVSTT